MLVDVNMPKMDGYELVARMRGEDNLKTIPIVMISTESGEQDATKPIAAAAISIFSNRSPRMNCGDRAADDGTRGMSNPLLATFIPEARDLIQISAAGLLKLEKQPDNSDAVNEVFRAVHTLKGSSGLFEAAALTRLVHARGSARAIRSESLELDSDLVDKLLDSLDLASTWIDHLERHEKMPPDADALSSGLLRELRLYATTDVAPASQAPKPAAAAVDRSAPDWLAGIEEGDRLAAFSVLASGAKVIGLFYRPAEGCFFNGDDRSISFTKFRN